MSKINLANKIIVYTVVLALLVLAGSFGCIGNFEPVYEVTENADSYSIHSEWAYKSAVWKYDLEIAKSVYDDYTAIDRIEEYEEYVVNSDDDALMSDLAALFKADSDEKRWDEYETAEFILSFVQSMPYEMDDVTTGHDEYPYYPVETLVAGVADCEDTVILFTSLARELDSGVAILIFEQDEHMAAGIKITQDYIDNWQGDYVLAYYTAENGDNYAYCETTGSGWRTGEKPGVIEGDPEIVNVSKVEVVTD